jgi:hypothetical protein
MTSTITTAAVPSTNSTAKTNGGQRPKGPHLIDGVLLAKALKAGDIKPEYAAKLAFELQTGTVILGHLTARQARQVTKATRSGLAAERRAHQPVKGPRVLYRCNPTDADIDKVIARVGADRIMKALDRYTQPSLLAAE